MAKKNIITTKISKTSKARAKHFKDFGESFIENLKVSKKDQKLYLQIALEEYEKEKNLENFLLALRTIAIAKGGFSDTNLNRQSLYKAFQTRAILLWQLLVLF